MEDKILTEKRLSKMEEKLDNLTDSVKDVHSDLKAHVQWESKKYDDLNTKFSGKWVERAVLFFFGIIATGIIGAILKLILK